MGTIDKTHYKENRQTHIDIIAGILIIHMILGHCIQYTDMRNIILYDIMNALYFFMPWFFFKSGMFYTHKSKSLYKVIISEGKKLLYPFFIFSLIGYFINLIFLTNSVNFNLKTLVIFPLKELIYCGALSSNAPLWFLFSLFLAYTIFSILYSLHIPPILIALLGFAIASFFYQQEINYPRYIANSSSGLFFYAMGYILKEKQYINAFFYLSFIIYILIAVNGYIKIDMNNNVATKGNYFVWYPASIVGIITLNNLISRLHIHIKWLSSIGKHSMNYYISHWIVICVFYKAVPSFNNYYKLFLLIGACIVILPFINKLLMTDKGKRLIYCTNT